MSIFSKILNKSIKKKKMYFFINNYVPKRIAELNILNIKKKHLHT